MTITHGAPPASQIKEMLAHTRARLRAQRPFAAPDVPKDGDKFKRFYNSRAWRAARYAYLATLKPEDRRCAACGATAADDRLIVDHVIPIKTEEGWSRRLTGPFQILCNTDNLSKGSHDTTDFRNSRQRTG
jgi:5-methylcytosine-specific restriction endonuclease McrA